MCGLVSLIPRATVVSTGPRTAPPPRVSAAGGLSEAARPLLDQHGYVLLEGLGSMMAGCTMIKFNSGTFGDSCATDMSEVRVLSRGLPNPLLADVGYEWHQDGGGIAPFLTLLHCKAACEGADSIFADGAVLFERLMPADQRSALARSPPCIE